MHVLTYNDGSGKYIPTDSYSWSNAFNVINNQPLPINSGVVCYHVYSNYLAVPNKGDTIDGNIFTYNFKSKVKKNITSTLGIINAMNPSFNSEGSRITFMAIPLNKANQTTYNSDKNYWQRLRSNLEIYIYDFASNSLTRLTNNNIPDEDPKFSPDGSKIIFKQNGILKIMDSSGNIISDLISNGNPINGSMPYYTKDGQKILYAKGADSTSDIYIVDIDGKNNKVLDAEANIDEYYPIVRDNSTFLYTRWVSSSKRNDQIYLGDFSGNNSSLLINSSISNFSDPAPVGSDYLFFSSTKSGKGYDLYLGQIFTGKIWSLNNLGIDDSLEDLGSCYTPILRNILVTAGVNPSNGGTVRGAGSYANGEAANLTATAKTGYDFVNWTENGTQVSSDTSYSFTVVRNRTLVANFSIQSFNISANTNPTNGGTVSGTGNYDYGQTCNLTATAKTGYDFVNWTESGTQVSSDTSYSFTVVGNRTLVANFAVQSFNISASTNPTNGGTVSGTGNYDYGQTCNLTATSETGYDFVNWTESGAQVSSDTSYSFTVMRNRTLVANFEKTVSVVEIKENKHVNIYPNPTTGKVIIRGENIKMIEVINLNMQVIKRIKTETVETNIDLSNQAKGFYFIKVVTNDKTIIEKIVLN